MSDDLYRLSARYGIDLTDANYPEMFEADVAKIAALERQRDAARDELIDIYQRISNRPPGYGPHGLVYTYTFTAGRVESRLAALREGDDE